MALSLSFTPNDTPTGQGAPNGYLRVSEIHIDDQNRVSYKLDYWTSRAWAKSGVKVPWKSERRTMENFQQGGGNPKTQIYTQLKVEMPNAVDSAE